MSNKSNSNSFLLQGTILAVAGLLVRVIGLIYRIPLTNILGEKGMGCYGTAFDIYNILLLLSSQSMPLAVSKLVSEKIGKRQYNNAFKIFKGALLYSGIIGIVFGLFAFFGADWLASELFHTPTAARALKVLAPTITVVCVLGVLRGYFQGLGTMIPTAVSQIFEQILNAVVSVVAAFELVNYGHSVSKMLSEDKAEAVVNSWGAAGGTLGTFAGALIALIIMILVYCHNRNIIKKGVRRFSRKPEDSYSLISKMIVFTITPVLISTTIYNISNLLDNPIYQNITMYVFDIEESARLKFWGIYSSQYRVLTTLPIAIASALATAIVPSMVRSFSARDNELVKSKIETTLKFAMLIAFPCGMGLSVLGGPINRFIFPNLENGMFITQLMIFSIFTVVFFSLSTISNAVLQGIDRLKVPIKNSAIALGIHIVILPILLIVFRMNLFAVVIGDFTFALTVCILNARSIKIHTGYKQEYTNTFIKPLISSAVMGVVCYLVYILINMITKSNALATIISIIFAVAVYGVMVIVTNTITEEELLEIPKGEAIIRLLNKLHLM